MKKTLLVVLMICSFPVLLLISVRIADPFFSKRFNPRSPHIVLLVWPDHVEIRQVESISEVSPRPPNAGYVFSVPPERVAWIEEQVRKIPPPSPDPDSAWLIRVRQVTRDRQQIQLEAWWKNEFRGMIYEATRNEIVPLKTRTASIGEAVQIGGIDFAVWCGAWITVWLVWRLVAKR
jgi:hypothetical protein